MPEPLDRRRPFTRAEALAAGLTDRMLDGPRFRRVFTGVHVGAGVPLSPRVRAEAALRLHPPSAFLSHLSAARILGLPVPSATSEHVTVSHADHRRRNKDVRCHVSQDPRDIVLVGGLRVSSPARVFIELATVLGLVDLVAVGDQLVAHGHLSANGLRVFCANRSLAGVKAARRAAAYVRAGVDSPMESRLRMLLVLAGLPEPVVNAVVRADDGAPLRRYDLSYPGAKVAVEYDGRHHVERVDQWERDLDRREAIDDSSWRLLVVTARDIYSRPEDTVRRVHRLLLARGMPGTPAVLSEGWRLHFDTRG